MQCASLCCHEQRTWLHSVPRHQLDWQLHSLKKKRKTTTTTSSLLDHVKLQRGHDWSCPDKVKKQKCVQGWSFNYHPVLMYTSLAPPPQPLPPHPWDCKQRKLLCTLLLKQMILSVAMDEQELLDWYYSINSTKENYRPRRFSKFPFNC